MDGDFIYAIGSDGDLACLETRSGKIRWQKSLRKEFGGQPGEWAYAESLLVDGDVLVATPGAAYYKQQRLPNPYNFKASPVGANGKLYLATEDGDVVVVKMGEKYEALATNSLPDQMFIASPAIAGGSLYLRSQNSLYCIQEARR